jgi:micrococcal nuclease
VLAAFAGLVLLRWWQESRGAAAPDTLDEGLYAVAEVIDGDTLRLANQAIVRLIGANAPYLSPSGRDTNPWPGEAAEFTRRFIADRPVRLVFDRERLDRQGHFWAYVYVGNRLLNEELLRAGLARVQMRPSFSAAKKRLLDRAEQEARKAHRGLWSRAGID